LKGYMNSLLFLDALLAKVNMLKKIYESDTSSVLFNTIRATNQLCDSLINQLRQSFKTHQDKIALAKKAKQTYEGAISTHLLFDSTFSANETAFYYAEKSKVSTLAGVLMDLQAKKISNIPDSLLSQEQSLKDQRSLHQSKQQDAYLEGDSLLAQQHQNELFTVNQQYDSLIEAFEQQYPQYYQLKHNNEVISVETLQNQLSPETALLEYFMGDSATYAFTITNNSIHIATLPSDSTQQSQIQELRTLLSPEGAVQFNQQKYEQLATALYQTVVTPALDSLPTSITKLQIVPDGELGYLPFELLLTDNTSDADYRSLPYLMRDYVISYGYSATWLYQPFSRREQPVTQQYLAFAPSYENALTDSIQLLAVGRFRDQVLPLEWNQQEARAIDQHLSGQTYVGLEAQERYFKKQASQSQILHLAMHALVDDQNPMYSRLVFSPNPSDSVEDGFLNAYELYNMEIPADLAVLSACETGYGKLERGEGIMSLARAFAYAGCPSLVMSHWTVDDQSTAQLMGYFYELLADGLPKDEALHQAKLRFLDKTNIPTTHPFFWGSFVVMGDTSPITQPNNWTVWYYSLSIISLLSITTVVYTRRKV
ncbi:MAG: CHAT domain-containing protein, partial [Bacteroidota bacterium]